MGVNSVPIVQSVGSTLQPIRLSLRSGSWQIMNLSTTATVWIGNDTSVQSNAGVPLYPGAGLIYEADQIFAILGNDAASVTAGSASLACSDVVQQWQPNPVAIAEAIINSGTIVIDNPVQITQQNVTATGNLGRFDVSTYQSILINLDRVVDANSLQLLIFWYGPQGTGVFSDDYIMGLDQYNWIGSDSNRLVTTLPCRGSQVEIHAIRGGAGTSILTVFGSHRPFVQLMNGGYAAGSRVLGTATNTVLPASGSITCNGPRYDGPMMIMATMWGAPGASPQLTLCNDLWTGLPFGGGQSTGILQLGSQRSMDLIRAVAPRNSWSVTLYNGSGSNQNAFLQVVASPEGT